MLVQSRRRDRLAFLVAAAEGIFCGAVLVALSTLGPVAGGAQTCTSPSAVFVHLHFVGRGVSADGASFYENFSFGTYPDFAYSVGPSSLVNRTAANGTDPAAYALVSGTAAPAAAFATCTGAGGLAACSANRAGWYVVLTDDAGTWLASYPAPGGHWNVAPGSAWAATNVSVVSPADLNGTGDTLAFVPQGWGGCGSYGAWEGRL